MSVGDTNQDGVIDEEEYFLEVKREIPGWRWNAKETKVAYDLCDLNSDRLVSPDELRNGLETMRHVFRIHIIKSPFCVQLLSYVQSDLRKLRYSNCSQVPMWNF